MGDQYSCAICRANDMIRTLCYRLPESSSESLVAILRDTDSRLRGRRTLGLSVGTQLLPAFFMKSETMLGCSLLVGLFRGFIGSSQGCVYICLSLMPYSTIRCICVYMYSTCIALQCLSLCNLHMRVT